MDGTRANDNNGIVVENLTKRFGKLLVLDRISFTVSPGELLCIVGPTGCGKTTFMNTLAKLTPATAGSIRIRNEEADPRKHNIAYVFQESTSLPWRIVRDNIALGMELKKIPKPEIERRLNQILEIVGLSDCADLYPNQISASMEQRLSVARAFATQPDLLLMDEPYGQLDVQLRFYLEDELVRIWEKFKNTVIFVTHNIEEAVYLADRILILSNKPTTIKGNIMVDLPRPRDYIDPKFMAIREEVTDMIRWW
ncbi:MAG TPA: ABC transporter ATP-binding protein [Syntrophobacteraceae bacterium]|jgi:ABC-type nitrate/sulfonate/bicarbonate transport system ATPase subunit|nr:ABC transporter ATP-binding protein [Syntrophobacteraceae bacterium]